MDPSERAEEKRDIEVSKYEGLHLIAVCRSLRHSRPSSTRMRIIVRARAVVIQPGAVRVSGAVRRYIRAGVTPHVSRTAMRVGVRPGPVAIAGPRGAGRAPGISWRNQQDSEQGSKD